MSASAPRASANEPEAVPLAPSLLFLHFLPQDDNKDGKIVFEECVQPVGKGARSPRRIAPSLLRACLLYPSSLNNGSGRRFELDADPAIGAIHRLYA